MAFTHKARGFALLLLALRVLQSHAAEFRRLDGIHRVAKAQITQPAELRPREDVCQTGMKQCPYSLGGGCCPDSYDCAQKSCYATTKGPSTCGTKVGFHACGAVYGGGCCPDGLVCERPGNCVPPSGSTYSFDCPASQYLCPSSLGYGCCPNGMGCGANQCYSTSPSTKTTTMTVTTTNSGKETVYTSTAVTVVAPTTPTASPTAEADGSDDETVVKFFPSSLPQSPPSSDPTEKDNQRGLSEGQLGGIVAGAGAILLMMLLAAYITIRHLNKVVAAVGPPKRSHSPNSHRQMRQSRRGPNTNPLGAGSSSVASSTSSSRRQSSTTSSLQTPDNTQSSFVGGFRWFRNRSTGNSSVSTNDGLSGFFRRLFGSPIWGSSHIDKRLSLNHEENSALRRKVYARYSSSCSRSSNDVESVAASRSSPSELEARVFPVELPVFSSPPGSVQENETRPSRKNTYSPAKPAMIYQHKQTGSQDSGLQEMAKTYFLPVVVEELPSPHSQIKKETPPKNPFRFGITSWFESGSSNCSTV